MESIFHTDCDPILKALTPTPLRSLAIAVLAACTVVVLVSQTQSLFTVPLFDSYRWWGDESWLMIEFREQIYSGILRHPYAIGATISHSNGILFGSMWITALLYGLPGLLLHSDLVSIGRVVTFVLSLALLVLLYRATRRESPVEVSMIAVLLLILGRFYLWSSHSARHDLFTGLAVLAVVVLLRRLLSGLRKPQISFLAGLTLGAVSLVTVHALLVLPFVGAYALITTTRRSGVKHAALMLLGAVCPIALSAIFYWMVIGQLTLFGITGTGGFNSNFNHIPALHLLSRNVWMNSFSQKLQSCWEMAWYLPVIFCFALVCDLWKLSQARSFAALSLERQLGWLAVAGYFAFEGPQFFYLIFIAPIVVLLFAGSLNLMLHKRDNLRYALLIVGSVALTIAGVTDATKADRIGTRLKSNQAAAHATLHKWCDSVFAATHEKPRVLIAAPTLDRAIGWSSIQPISTQFFDFPEDGGSLSNKLDRLHVEYIEVFASGLTSFYIPEQYELRNAAESLGAPILRIPGIMIDPGRSYFRPMDERQDTLLIYRWH